ncbi:MAG: class II glutamine amidotransferase [Caldisphaeraceae archaeon]|nr:class II glutamine amidotransferase [Caldisphaeraceae archaeon]
MVTDSEVFFHLVVQEAEDLGNPVEGIRSAAEKIIENDINFSSLNFIASDRDRLYALRCAKEQTEYYILYYLERPGEGFELKRLSKETSQLIMTKLAHREKAILIASEPMSDELSWIPISNGYLMVVGPDLGIQEVKVI